MSFIAIKEILALQNFFKAADITNRILLRRDNSFSLSIELPNGFFYEDTATGDGAMGLTEGTTFHNQGISLASDGETRDACSVVIQTLSSFEHLFANNIRKIRLYEGDKCVASWSTFVDAD